MSYVRKEVLAEGIEVYQADCLELLPTLGRFDAVVTDPPYGVSYDGSTTKHGTNGGSYSSFDDTPESIAAICVPAVRLAVEHSRSAVVTPGNANAHLYDPPRSQGAIFYPSGANCGPWGFVCSQPLFYYGADSYLAAGKGSRPNGFQTTEATDRNIAHPCPKPIGVMMWMVTRASLAGHSILDPFMGSGTTGVAAVKLGRKFTNIEIDPGYFDIACRRISEALKQPDMFVEAPKPAHQLSILDGDAA